MENIRGAKVKCMMCVCVCAGHILWQWFWMKGCKEGIHMMYRSFMKHSMFFKTSYIISFPFILHLPSRVWTVLERMLCPFVFYLGGWPLLLGVFICWTFEFFLLFLVISGGGVFLRSAKFSKIPQNLLFRKFEGAFSLKKKHGFGKQIANFPAKTWPKYCDRPQNFLKITQNFKTQMTTKFPPVVISKLK